MMISLQELKKKKRGAAIKVKTKNKHLFNNIKNY